MTSWRIWLLLLLAVLLPVRGAMAAAMLCPAASADVQMGLAIDGQAVEHEDTGDVLAHHHADAHVDAVSAVSQHHDAPPEHDPGAPEGCNNCSAYCSATPLVAHLPTLQAPLDLTAVKFDDLSAPAPSFVSDGQDRPPRTI